MIGKLCEGGWGVEKCVLCFGVLFSIPVDLLSQMWIFDLRCESIVSDVNLLSSTWTCCLRCGSAILDVDLFFQMWICSSRCGSVM